MDVGGPISKVSVDCLWEDCQPDLFAHYFDFLARLCIGPSTAAWCMYFLN